MSIDFNALADGVRVSPKASLPQAITDHDNWMGAWRLVIRCGEHSSLRRRDSQRGKVVTRGERAVDAFGGAVAPAETERSLIVGNQIGTNLIQLTVVTKGWVRKV